MAGTTAAVAHDRGMHAGGVGPTAVKASATLGEISQVLREEWGTHDP